MDMAIDHNIALASLSRLSNRRIIRRSAESKLAADWAVRLRLKYGRLKDSANTLSGATSRRLSWLNGLPGNPLC